MSRKQPSLVQWISWIVATATAALTMAAYAFTNFETKEHAKEVKSDIAERLQSIEKKIDRVDTKLDSALHRR